MKEATTNYEEWLKWREEYFEMEKKTRHKGDEGTVSFWIYMKALYKDED